MTVDILCEALWGDNPFGYENSLNVVEQRKLKVRRKMDIRLF